MKNFYGIFFFFLDRNIDGNKKSFPPFQVCGNNMVMQRSLLPNYPQIDDQPI